MTALSNQEKQLFKQEVTWPHWLALFTDDDIIRSFTLYEKVFLNKLKKFS